MLAQDDLDSLFDVDPDQIPYISYLRALNTQLPIPGTIAFISNQLSLSRSKDRKGRLEFGQAINKQSMIVPQVPAYMMGGAPQQQDNKPGFISKFFNATRKKDGGTQ